MWNTTLDNKNKSSVQAHIAMLQGIIDRMARNSMQCKQWCIAIETILFGLAMDNMDWWVFGMAAITAITFMYLDAGYLCYERQVRTQQHSFIEKINRREPFEQDVFMVKPLSNDFCSVTKTVFSKYVWTCYFLIIAFMLTLALNK